MATTETYTGFPSLSGKVSALVSHRLRTSVERREDGCWAWLGSHELQFAANADEYAGGGGRPTLEVRDRGVLRGFYVAMLMYEFWTCDLRHSGCDGVVTTCGWAGCVNPDHLVATGGAEATLTVGNRKRRRAPEEGLCVAGHVLERVGVYEVRGGRVKCRACVEEECWLTGRRG